LTAGNDAKCFLRRPLDGSLVEVADGHDGHQIGPVPVLVEPLQRVVLERLDRLLLPDGRRSA